MTSTTLSPIDLEQKIVERLKARLLDVAEPLVRFVYDTAEYTDVEEESQLVPSLAVIYNGYRTGEQVGQGQVQQVESEFLVVVVTRSSKDTLRKSGAKASAGVIFHAAIQALAGWKPAQGVGRLKLADAPGAGYSDAGLAYLPIMFTSSTTYTHTP